MKKNKIVDAHDCRFNDGEEVCECFAEGVCAGLDATMVNIARMKLSTAEFMASKNENHAISYNEALNDVMNMLVDLHPPSDK